MPDHILIVNYVVENKPYIDQADRFVLEPIDKRVYELTLHYGFMDSISIPLAIQQFDALQKVDFVVYSDNTLYFVEIPNITAAKTKHMFTFFWQEKLFIFLMRNYSVNLNIDFFKLPYHHTVAIGTYCQI